MVVPRQAVTTYVGTGHQIRDVGEVHQLLLELGVLQRQGAAAQRDHSPVGGLGQQEAQAVAAYQTGGAGEQGVRGGA